MGNHSEIFSVVAWAVPSVLLLYLLAQKAEFVSSLFSAKLLVFLGNISFELFLVHQLMIRYAEFFWKKLFPSHVAPAVVYILVLLLAVVVSWGIHTYRKRRR